MKRSRLKFLNVVDDRWPDRYSTIIYTGELRPCEEGFMYSFSYGTGKGWTINGFGMVESEKYSRMSPEEIELICSAERPPSSVDIYGACLAGDMTRRYAEKYSGAKGASSDDAW